MARVEFTKKRQHAVPRSAEPDRSSILAANFACLQSSVIHRRCYGGRRRMMTGGLLFPALTAGYGDNATRSAEGARRSAFRVKSLGAASRHGAHDGAATAPRAFRCQ